MLKVIGAGFGRTGTLSLKTALETLGFGPCYHMVEVIDNLDRIDDWTAAMAGEPDWDRTFAGYQATVDWPGCTYWRELADRYPRAKVLLSVRDPEKWYDSVANTIYYVSKLAMNPETMPPAMRERLAGLPRDDRRKLVDELIWQRTFGGRFEDRAYAISVFEQHNQAVRDAIPADRLLEYQVGEGWQRLCDFLGAPVPDEDFPRVNDGASFREMVLEGKLPEN
ncbi:sulfotransferase family protein [Fodinicola acaciae]|uniref:sulfotransferase family protein n=1 Tax=Fodinicola acaciae TaxID=2681555 RepID=UPI0013D01AFB|nr:sulfotransferase family protein [Fodinicola acaciae]